MTIDLDAIEAAALAARDEDSWFDMWHLPRATFSQFDAHYIATMDPQTTLALVERVRELEAQMDCVLGVASQCEFIQQYEIAKRIRDAAKGLPT